MSSDQARLAAHFDDMSTADQHETAFRLESFTAWLKAIKALADLVPYAKKLWKWLRRRF
ncbi:hypothetical protein ACHBTE_29795 [Streptomyces sp. M41]|uniref:hypothetical protein n=1 Tax=Streptomyces sp. M41 TaxID=3059412 RepID=UPI00374D4036